MQIDIEQIRNGSLDGNVVYVCDYRRPDLDKKPIRSVPPTKVLVRSNSNTTKRIYYSESHFAVLKKNGEASTKVIPLFDNTGYRSFTGTPLNVFDNVQECNDCWNDQVSQVIDRLVEKRSKVHEEIDADINLLNSLREKL